MSRTVVDKIFEDFRDLLNFLDSEGEISFRNAVEENFRKALLLASASHFEVQMREKVTGFFKRCAKNRMVFSALRIKAIERQYHTWFDWDKKNANKLFAMFGDEFRAYMKKQEISDPRMAASIVAFMEIGATRNLLVHEDYASFSLEKTAEEIYELYKQALIFVEKFSFHLETCASELESANPEPDIF